MKRSEINAAIRWAKAYLKKENIRLPAYAYWTVEEWKEHAEETELIERLMLGWDVTDFGTGDFGNIGGVLYTLRNGIQDDPTAGVPYCEKLIVMHEGQRLPRHYHVSKTEDIINRAGGTLQVFLWNADPVTGRETDSDVTVWMDGIRRVFKAGEEILVTPGNSVTLTPYLAHVFGPKLGTGDVICGEVSKVNDDRTDNYFTEPTARFPEVEEDEAADAPLCGEYGRFIR